MARCATTRPINCNIYQLQEELSLVAESKDHPQAGPASRSGKGAEAARSKKEGNPRWFVPVMAGLMIFGVLWVATFYITGGDWPSPLGYWNLAVGMGAIMIGFIMATRWQ